MEDKDYKVSCIVITMSADGREAQGAKTSAYMILT